MCNSIYIFADRQACKPSVLSTLGWCSSQIPMITQIFNIFAMATQKQKKHLIKMHAVVSLTELLTRKSHLANSCTLRKTSQNMGWGLPGNPLDTLSQQQVGDRWGSRGGRRHLNSFHDLHFLWASSINRQKRRKKRQIGKKESMGLTKGCCWCWTVSQAASRPALQWSIPSQDCNVVPLSWLQPGGDNIAVIMITRLMIIITIITVWLLSSSVISLVSRLSTYCTLCTPHTVSIFTLLLTNNILELHTRRE